MSRVDDSDKISRQLFDANLIAVAPILPVLGYLLWVLYDLRPEHSVQAGVAGALLLAVGILAGPLMIIRSRTRAALAELPTDKPGDRLSRILQLPRKTELDAGFVTLFAAGATGAWASWAFDRSPWLVLMALCLVGALNMLSGLRYALRAEQILQETAVAEFHRHPSSRPEGPMMLWPRLRWYLGFQFTAILFTSLAVVATLLIGKGQSAINRFVDSMFAEGRVVPADLLDAELLSMHLEIGLPLAALTVFMIVLVHVTARNLGRRYETASSAIIETVDNLATGKPTLPEWIGTDEFGDLALGLSSVFDRLRTISSSLQESAVQLAEGARQLGGTTGRQNETLTRQAAALQETEVTAQEIRQTSLLAAQKTEAVLKTAERAEEISKAGEGAIEQSLSGLTDIQGVVTEMADRIRALSDRTRQIASITVAVKDLADQSNMLALNAAIEAVRSGEHGKGFGVVAREIRSLADQSIQATNRVREILEDISEAIRSTVAITERGADKVQVSLEQVRTSGESLGELSSIVRDNAMAVRQIAAAVGQQNAGIGQIFEAVRDLSRMMDETIDRLKATAGASDLVNRVAADVSAVVASYGVEKQAPAEDTEPLPVPVAAQA